MMWGFGRMLGMGFGQCGWSITYSTQVCSYIKSMSDVPCHDVSRGHLLGGRSAVIASPQLAFLGTYRSLFTRASQHQSTASS